MRGKCCSPGPPLSSFLEAEKPTKNTIGHLWTHAWEEVTNINNASFSWNMRAAAQ